MTVKEEMALPKRLTGDLMRVALMEIAALIALRISIEHLFGIDIFDFQSPIGKLVAGSITITVFMGIYKVFSVDGKLADIGERVIAGGGAPSLSE